MRKILVIFLVFCSLIEAGAVTLSDSAKISLLTCGPGTELYAKFGHSAIRIYDPTNNLDVSFNYGYFDFNAPGFYYKFINGETDYQLGVCETSQFFLEYQIRQINLWEQELNLRQNEKQVLFDALNENYKPENRFYRYNYVFDNCATRPRDMILNAIDGKVIFDKQLENKKETFQHLIDLYTVDSPSILFGIHLILGASKNDTATFMQTMFLPERLMQAFATARIQRDSVAEPLVKSSSQPVVIQGNEIKPAFNYVPVLAVLLLLITLWISRKDWQKRTVTFWFDAILFGLGGVAGIIIFYLTSFSVHPLVSSNWNVVWLNPLLVVFALLVIFPRTRKIAFYLQGLLLVCTIFMLASCCFLKQCFTISEILLMVVFALRSITYLRLKNEYLRLKIQNKKEED
jgi:hypothetical protein